MHVYCETSAALAEVSGWAAEARGAFANIKPMATRKTPQVFSTYLYRWRNFVERFVNKLKHFRAVATRYDKRADNFLASIQLASMRIWINA